MSGLLCVFDPSGLPQDLPRYLSALRHLAHRGPDGEGTYLRPQLFLGHRRRGGGDESQPLEALGGQVAIAFDGRLTNRAALAHALAARGSVHEQRSDASLALDAYLEYGAGCFEKLEGTWGLVLWDGRTRELRVSRDRLGVCPLYYFEGPPLIVASEIKAILALEDRARVPNLARVWRYLPDGAIDDWSETFFLGVQPVPPATVLTTGNGGIGRSRFWTLAPSTNDRLRPADMFALLRETVDRDTPAGVNVGVSLSGGIDSSSLVGLLTREQASAGRRVEAFSIRPAHTPDESPLIDATVRQTRVPHRYVSLDSLDHRQALQRLLRAHDEPVQWIGNLYQFVLRQAMAEAGCNVVVVGYGADEIFAGYEFLASAFLISLMASGRLVDSLRFGAGARALLGDHPLQALARAARGVARGLARKEPGAGGVPPHRLSPAAFRLVSDLLAPADATKDVPPRPAEFDASGLRSGSHFFRALLGCFAANIPLLARIEERNATANGLELCAPFLDHRVVEMALAFPFHQYMEGGANKAILRRAVAGLLAPEVAAQRRKFHTPGNDAYAIYDLLRPAFLEMLESSAFAASGIWSPGCRELYLRDSATRARPGVWMRIYMVQRWHELVVQGEL